MSETKATNITFHGGHVGRADRERALGQRGCTLWFTGLSGSGKSTVAVALEAELHRRGKHVYRLDGDNIRFGLNKNLGFSAEDRHENIRRIGEIARLMADAGLICLCSFVSPYRADRALVRGIHEAGGGDAGVDPRPEAVGVQGGVGGGVGGGLPFLEVFVDVPIEVAESRDPKGLYKKARAGEIKNFTGIDDPFEAPEKPELRLPTHELAIEASVARLVEAMEQRGLLGVEEAGEDGDGELA